VLRSIKNKIIIISKHCLEKFKHNLKDPIERDLARYWNN